MNDVATVCKTVRTFKKIWTLEASWVHTGAREVRLCGGLSSDRHHGQDRVGRCTAFTGVSSITLSPSYNPRHCTTPFTLQQVTVHKHNRIRPSTSFNSIKALFGSFSHSRLPKRLDTLSYLIRPTWTGSTSADVQMRLTNVSLRQSSWNRYSLRRRSSKRVCRPGSTKSS